MKIAIITAMQDEFRAVAGGLGIANFSQLGACRIGRFGLFGHKFLLLESGMGFNNAAMAAEMLIREERPDLLISAGFCGAVAPELRAGDVVVAKKIIISDGNGFEEVPVQLSDIGQTFVMRQAAQGKKVAGGTFVSTSTITSKGRLAGMLSGQDANPVVEMESGAIAIIAAENSIPLLAIRAVSDCASEELGFSLEEFCDQDMRRIRLHKVLLTALRKPRIIPQLVRLSRSSRRAAESLSATFSSLFATL